LINSRYAVDLVAAAVNAAFAVKRDHGRNREQGQSSGICKRNERRRFRIDQQADPAASLRWPRGIHHHLIDGCARNERARHRTSKPCDKIPSAAHQTADGSGLANLIRVESIEV
jgi:hypothetical protein